MPDPVILEPPRREWDCPNCVQTDITHEARPHTRMHACPGLGGIIAPFVERRPNRGRVAVRKKVREDYVGTERGLRYDEDGQPIMAVETEHPDGHTDLAVFAPCVTVDGAARERGRD